MTAYDIAIVGAGPVGLTLALGYGQQGLRVLLIDKVARADMLAQRYDGRTTALSLSSRRVLGGVGAWERLSPQAQPITDIRVQEGHRPFVLHFDHRDVGGEPMGHIVENIAMRQSLADGIDALPTGAVTWVADTVTNLHTSAALATLHLASGTTETARLVIAADGKYSPLRERLGIKTRRLTYGQTAIVTMINHTLPHNGLALERFYPSGPFAILPMVGNRSSVVWSEPDAAAAYYLGCDEGLFLDALRARAGNYLGDISLHGGRYGYPLMLQQASAYIAPRVALAGDTAHAIHPIAGQGVNLGMRDVALLLELVVDAARLGQDIGAETVLKPYARRRSLDVHAMMASTDVLTRLFSNAVGPVALARTVGLGLVQRIPPFKRAAMRYAMGLGGMNPPRLLKGEAL